MEYKNRFLYLIWKDPKTRRNFTVGKLSYDTVFRFQYCEEYQQAQSKGWTGLDAFPIEKGEQKTFENDTLFPAFASRLPDPKRRDIEKILQKYSLNEYDSFQLLQRSGARLPIDTYEFINPIFQDDEVIEQEFFIMGTRHVAQCKGTNCSMRPHVEKNEQLKLMPNPENTEDPEAIMVETMTEEKIGFVPRYYNHAILERLKRKVDYQCTVVEVSEVQNCSECIRVHLLIPNIS